MMMKSKIIHFPLEKRLAKEKRANQKRIKQERTLLKYMIMNKSHAYKVMKLSNGSPFNFDEHEAIFTYLMDFYEQSDKAEPIYFLDHLPFGELRSLSEKILAMPYEEDCFEYEVNLLIAEIKKGKEHGSCD